jgi:hypothetical protein
MPVVARTAAASDTATTAPARPIENLAMARIGPTSHRSCGGGAMSGGTSVRSVGTNTSDITKSTITPVAAPIPNVRTE